MRGYKQNIEAELVGMILAGAIIVVTAFGLVLGVVYVVRWWVAG